MANPSESGFTFKTVALLESKFKRSNKIETSGESVMNEVDISSDFEVKDEHILCSVTMVFTSSYKGKNQIKASIKMLGIFGIQGKPKLDPNSFGEVNAPSLVFPYIREHLSSLSIRAGLSPIMLSPINFTALAKKKKKGKQA